MVVDLARKEDLGTIVDTQVHWSKIQYLRFVLTAYGEDSGWVFLGGITKNHGKDEDGPVFLEPLTHNFNHSVFFLPWVRGPTDVPPFGRNWSCVQNLKCIHSIFIRHTLQ